MRDRTWVIAITLIIMFIVSGVFVLAGWYTVGVGEAAMLVNPVSGEVTEPSEGPKWGWRWPWIGVKTWYYATDTLGMWGNGTDPYADFPGVACFSEDQLEMDIDVMVRWSLDLDRLNDLYMKYPHKDYKDKTIASIVRETIRFTTKDYSAVETVAYREQIAMEIEEKIIEAVANDESLCGALVNVDFDLRNIGLPQKYVSSIEDKLVAEQMKIQAEFEKERILILAEATAQEQIIKAGGIAEARIIQANGTREAINLIVNLNPEISAEKITELYMWLEALKELDIPIMLIGLGEDGLPIIIQP